MTAVGVFSRQLFSPIAHSCLLVPDISLKFSLKQLSRGVPKNSCSAKWCDEIMMWCTNGQKRESVSCKFLKIVRHHRYFQRIWIQVQKAILKNTSRWLLLRKVIVWEHSWMIASQRQLRGIVHFKSSNATSSPEQFLKNSSGTG